MSTTDTTTPTPTPTPAPCEKHRLEDNKNKMWFGLMLGVLFFIIASPKMFETVGSLFSKWGIAEFYDKNTQKLTNAAVLIHSIVYALLALTVLQYIVPKLPKAKAD